MAALTRSVSAVNALVQSKSRPLYDTTKELMGRYGFVNSVRAQGISADLVPWS